MKNNPTLHRIEETKKPCSKYDFVQNALNFSLAEIIIYKTGYDQMLFHLFMLRSFYSDGCKHNFVIFPSS